jgi:Mg2+/Co2+ transporter CorC
MSEISDSRTPRDDGAEDHHSLGHLFKGWLRTVMGGRGDSSLRATIEELIDDSDSAEESVGAGERALLTNILKLRGRTVADVMVPRADIVALDIETPFPTLIQKIAEEGHSRLPVFRETLDDVIGVIHIKDVLTIMARQALGEGADADLQGIVREVKIVAPSMRVLDLLVEMRQSRSHLALVVDEFGGIDGLVTIEDLVEEIVGEIEDEHDEAAPPPAGRTARRQPDRRRPFAHRGFRGARRPGSDGRGARGHRHAGRLGRFAGGPRAGPGRAVDPPVGPGVRDHRRGFPPFEAVARAQRPGEHLGAGRNRLTVPSLSHPHAVDPTLGLTVGDCVCHTRCHLWAASQSPIPEFLL